MPPGLNVFTVEPFLESIETEKRSNALGLHLEFVCLKSRISVRCDC